MCRARPAPDAASPDTGLLAVWSLTPREGGIDTHQDASTMLNANDLEVEGEREGELEEKLSIKVIGGCPFCFGFGL